MHQLIAAECKEFKDTFVYSGLMEGIQRYITLQLFAETVKFCYLQLVIFMDLKMHQFYNYWEQEFLEMHYLQLLSAQS